MTIPVILDCDTGTDDAVAIMLAALHPGLDLLGVTTVWGNHDVRHTTDNTLRVLDLVGRGDVPVHTGANTPFRPRLTPLPSGRPELAPVLDLPAARSSAGEGAAVEWLVEALREAAAPVTVVTTGPLTNLAAAVATDTGLVDHVDRLVVLGGTHRRAGVTPYAERNVWCDPEAAAFVLAAGFRRPTLVGMDATYAVPLDADDAAALAARGTPAGLAAAQFVVERIETYRSDPAMAARAAAPLHDPLAVACLLDPEVVTTVPARCVVETSDPTTYGATRFDLDPPDATLEVALDAVHARYLALLLESF
jgi:inosine-uridine nucleoside N-ribohydrolase